mgnify:CR=1 FL=1
MINEWCVVAYRVSFGIDVYGPYELRAEAATQAVMLAARSEYDTAVARPLLAAS